MSVYKVVCSFVNATFFCNSYKQINKLTILGTALPKISLGFLFWSQVDVNIKVSSNMIKYKVSFFFRMLW